MPSLLSGTQFSWGNSVCTQKTNENSNKDAIVKYQIDTDEMCFSSGG